MVVAEEGREAKNKMNRSDYVKGRGSLKCIAMHVGGAGICTQMEGRRPPTGSGLVHQGGTAGTQSMWVQMPESGKIR